MSERIAYASIAEGSEMAGLIKRAEAVMGFVPNSLLVMARRPELVKAFMGLVAATRPSSDKITPAMRQLVAYAASLAAGCLYCQAHTADIGAREGLEAEKVAQAWNYEHSPLFSEAERAAMSFAQAAAAVPNAVTDAHFETLRLHFSDDEIVDLLAIVSLFGFLNRWNDSLATTLEDSPRQFGEDRLHASGWSTGKHK